MGLKMHSNREFSGIESTLQVLSHEYRRWLLTYFYTYDRDAASLDTLVNVIEFLDSQTDRNSVKIQLAHNHLPKLKYNGIIEYEDEPDQVKYIGNEFVEDILDATLKHDSQISKYLPLD